jgi:hypothetical protein
MIYLFPIHFFNSYRNFFIYTINLIIISESLLGLLFLAFLFYGYLSLFLGLFEAVVN